MYDKNMQTNISIIARQIVCCDLNEYIKKKIPVKKYKAFIKAETQTIRSYCPYHYRQHSESMMRKKIDIESIKKLYFDLGNDVSVGRQRYSSTFA